jgi:thiol-disulfide isomerase/thioredoxin
MNSKKKTITEIIEVTTPTCGQCKMIAPAVKKLMDSTIGVKFTIVDGTQNPDLCKQHNIVKVPVFIIKYSNGEEAVLRDGNVYHLKKCLEYASK